MKISSKVALDMADWWEASGFTYLGRVPKSLIAVAPVLRIERCRPYSGVLRLVRPDVGRASADEAVRREGFVSGWSRHLDLTRMRPTGPQ